MWKNCTQRSGSIRPFFLHTSLWVLLPPPLPFQCPCTNRTLTFVGYPTKRTAPVEQGKDFVGVACGCFLYQNFSSFFVERKSFQWWDLIQPTISLGGTDGSSTCLEFCVGGRLIKRDPLDFIFFFFSLFLLFFFFWVTYIPFFFFFLIFWVTHIFLCFWVCTFSASL